MKVWILLWDQHYESSEIVGVYDSKEKAKAAAQTFVSGPEQRDRGWAERAQEWAREDECLRWFEQAVE